MRRFRIRQAFLSGDLALYLGYASEAIPHLGKPEPEFQCLALYHSRQQRSSKSALRPRVCAYDLRAARRMPVARIKAAALLTNPNEQMIAVAVTGLAPATLAQLGVAPSDPVDAVAYAEALYAKGVVDPQRLQTRTFLGDDYRCDQRAVSHHPQRSPQAKLAERAFCKKNDSTSSPYIICALSFLLALIALFVFLFSTPAFCFLGQQLSGGGGSLLRL